MTQQNLLNMLLTIPAMVPLPNVGIHRHKKFG